MDWNLKWQIWKQPTRILNLVRYEISSSDPTAKCEANMTEPLLFQFVSMEALDTLLGFFCCKSNCFSLLSSLPPSLSCIFSSFKSSIRASISLTRWCLPSSFCRTVYVSWWDTTYSISGMGTAFGWQTFYQGSLCQDHFISISLGFGFWEGGYKGYLLMFGFFLVWIYFRNCKVRLAKWRGSTAFIQINIIESVTALTLVLHLEIHRSLFRHNLRPITEIGQHIYAHNINW